MKRVSLKDGCEEGTIISSVGLSLGGIVGDKVGWGDVGVADGIAEMDGRSDGFFDIVGIDE